MSDATEQHADTAVDIFNRLTAPFPPDDIEWRVQRSGIKNGNPWAIVLAYVDSRAIRRRLNEVVGPQHWQTRFYPVGDRVACELSLRIDGEWISKCDGAGDTDFESAKGAFSSALKRAAYSWGIGEYLYDLDATFANIHDGGKHKDYIKEKNSNNGQWVKWDPPQLPEWAVPGGESGQPSGSASSQEASLQDAQETTQQHLVRLQDNGSITDGQYNALAAELWSEATNIDWVRNIYRRANQMVENNRQQSLDDTASKAFNDTDTERSQAEAQLPDSEPVDTELDEAKTDDGGLF